MEVVARWGASTDRVRTAAQVRPLLRVDLMQRILLAALPPADVRAADPLALPQSPQRAGAQRQQRLTESVRQAAAVRVLLALCRMPSCRPVLIHAGAVTALLASLDRGPAQVRYRPQPGLLTTTVT